MTTDSSSDHDDEIDLREIVLTLLRKWKLLLIVMVLAAAAAGVFSYFQQQKQPLYTASSKILIDQSIFSALTAQNGTPAPSSADLTSFLLSDPVRQKAAAILGIDAASLPTVSITPDAANSIYTITVEAASAPQAAGIANAWADAGIEWANQTLQLPNDEESQALAAVENADRALVEYLDQNGLGQLTWSDLGILTGVGSSASILQASAQPWPVISPAQRLGIARLMQARMTAQAEYAYAQDRAIQTRYALAVDQPMVLMRAVNANNKSNIARNVALGAIAGLILAVCWVFLEEWWRKGDDEKQEVSRLQATMALRPILKQILLRRNKIASQ